MVRPEPPQLGRVGRSFFRYALLRACPQFSPRTHPRCSFIGLLKQKYAIVSEAVPVMFSDPRLAELSTEHSTKLPPDAGLALPTNTRLILPHQCSHLSAHGRRRVAARRARSRKRLLTLGTSHRDLLGGIVPPRSISPRRSVAFSRRASISWNFGSVGCLPHPTAR